MLKHFYTSPSAARVISASNALHKVGIYDTSSHRALFDSHNHHALTSSSSGPDEKVVPTQDALLAFVKLYTITGTNYFSTSDLAIMQWSENRVGSDEIEAVIIEHYKIEEDAVVCAPYPLSGQRIVDFVTSNEKDENLINKVKKIGPQHRNSIISYIIWIKCFFLLLTT